MPDNLLRETWLYVPTSCNGVIRRDSRVRPRVSIALTSTTVVSHRAERRASYDMLCKQYTAKARRNREDQTIIPCLYREENREPASARAHYSISQESDVARSFLRATKGTFLQGMKISRKLKIGISPPTPPSSSLFSPPVIETPRRAEGKG